MADGFQIPKLTDKTIYISTTAGEVEIQKSYAVSASFGGILRLSPNNINSINETTAVQIYDPEGSGMTYTDALIGENITGIDSRLIKASDSVGQFIDLRYSADALESGNVYVIGQGAAQKLTIFCLNGATNRDEIFTLGKNVILPITTDDSIRLKEEGDWEYDRREIDVTSSSENSAILFNQGQSDKRHYRFEQSVALIRDVILQALRSMSTIPTGSIHFVPVNMAQYVALLKKGKPNVFRWEGVESDPIVRDFLLCDGSLYFSRDFPELAKILQHEKVTYWNLDDGVEKRVEHTNRSADEDAPTDGVYAFRVPDLRHAFPKSALLDFNSLGETWNKTGNWNVDNMPQYGDDAVADEHRHFITYGTYTKSYLDKTSFKKVAAADEDTDEEHITEPAIMLPTNGAGAMMYKYFVRGLMGYSGKENAANPYYYLTTPLKHDYVKMTFDADCGVTSYNLSAADYEVADSQLNYTDPANYVNGGCPYTAVKSFVATNTDNCKLYGYENTPEFVAMLPLIKI